MEVDYFFLSFDCNSLSSLSRGSAPSLAPSFAPQRSELSSFSVATHDRRERTRPSSLSGEVFNRVFSTMDADRLRRAIDRLLYLPSLRQGSSAGPSPALAAVAAAARERRRQGGGAGSSSSAAAFDPLPPRPWDRAELFRRAASFKASTWFAKDSETAGPLVVAARGWVNVGLDLLRCEFCGEKLAATTTTATGGGGGNGNGNDNEKAKNSFPSRLVSCHAAECPWRTGPACDLDSLAQFPPLTREAAEADFLAREAAALALDVLPPLSRESYYLPASVARERLEALLQLGPRPQGEGGEDEEELEEAPEPPVLLAAPEGAEDPPSSLSVAPSGSALHRRMCRLVALLGWSVEIVAPRVAKKALERAAGEEQRRMRACVEEATATAKMKRRKDGGDDDDAASWTDGTNAGDDDELALPLLWPPRPLPAHPPASAMPAGTVRACDAALRCEACGATAGLWSFVPSELCGGGEGGEEGGGGGAAAAKDVGGDSTPPAAKRAKGVGGWSPSSTSGKAPAAATAAFSRPRELDLVSLHRPWCPFVDPADPPGGKKGKDKDGGRRRRRRRVGWRWTLAALVPAVVGDDEAGEGDARLLRLEDEDDGEEEGGGAKKAGTAAAASASPPASSERATDRLRAVLARAGIVATAAKMPPPPSHPLVN